ncbi:hypothetical protein [Parasphingopyxis marina]|uniref:Uncharacterized protein n=1 Tax=Parasphingopyxis marina TaxID=2761622 RepID=A0A842HUC7_9SPHN|nr:hypothetical protein [Parasphingopyxis marina]MBC2776622.1 hypothetical protein [Parasphingopyxis marina]
MGKFARYFGARFGDRLVALENLEYGNALYLFEQDWEELTQISRAELIRRRDPAVHRIPHIRGWQSVIRKLVRKGRRLRLGRLRSFRFRVHIVANPCDEAKDWISKSI